MLYRAFGILSVLLAASSHAVTRIWERTVTPLTAVSEQVVFPQVYDSAHHLWLVTKSVGQPTQPHVRVARINPSGVVVWSQAFPGVDAKIQMVGPTDAVLATQSAQVQLRRIDAAGATVATRTVSGAGNQLETLASAGDGTVHLMVSQSNAYTLKKFSAALTEQWGKALGNTGVSADTLVVSTSGHAYLTGVPFRKLGLDGNQIWTRSFPATNAGMIELGPQSFLYVGTSSANGFPIVALNAQNGTVQTLATSQDIYESVPLNANCSLFYGSGAAKIFDHATHQFTSIPLGVDPYIRSVAKLSGAAFAVEYIDRQGPSHTKLFQAPSGAEIWETPTYNDWYLMGSGNGELSRFGASGVATSVRGIEPTSGITAWQVELPLISKPDQGIFHQMARMPNGDLLGLQVASTGLPSVIRMTREGATRWQSEPLNLSLGITAIQNLGILGASVLVAGAGGFAKLDIESGAVLLMVRDETCIAAAVAPNGDIYSLQNYYDAGLYAGEVSRRNPATFAKIWSRPLSTNTYPLARVTADSSGVFVFRSWFDAFTSDADLDRFTRAGTLIGTESFVQGSTQTHVGTEAYLRQWTDESYSVSRVRSGASALSVKTITGVPFGFVFVSGAPVPGGGVILAGNLDSDPALIKVNAAGACIWSRRFPVPDTDGKFRAVTVDAAGDAYVTGYRRVGALNRLITSKVRGIDGAPLWSYGSPSGPNVEPSNRVGEAIALDPATSNVFVFGDHQLPGSQAHRALAIGFKQ